jgi:hypothetical protein
MFLNIIILLSSMRIYNYILNEYEQDAIEEVITPGVSARTKTQVIMPQSNAKLYEKYSRPTPPITDVYDLTVHGTLKVEDDVSFDLGLSILGAVTLDSDLNVNNQTFLNRPRVDGDTELNGVLNVQNGVCNFRDVVCTGPAVFEAGLETFGSIEAPSFVTDNEHGYGSLSATGGGIITDPVTGLPIDTSTIELQQYNDYNDPGAYVRLDDNTVSLGKDVLIEGSLIIGEVTVEESLVTLREKAEEYLIGLASNYALDAAQQALLAALAAYAARPPSG